MPSAQLTAEEETLSRLAITRQTVLSVLGDDGAGVATPPHAASVASGCRTVTATYDSPWSHICTRS
jgi:hypothetical protein